MEQPNSCSKSKKRALEEDDTDGNVERDYRFKILLPNGICVGLVMRSPKPRMLFEDFLRLVNNEYDLTLRKSKSMKPTRPIQWNSGRAYVEDANENKIRNIMDFKKFKPYKCHMLRLYDGSGEIANTFENMWDLTPDTDLLMELPEEYTFETALADLIDNSLQAVWTNGKDERRLISVDIAEDRISIFDTGPGMDGSDENCIVKWGKMGASLHRSYKVKAIGSKPPYLTPFFGMFGYGGPIASMHLGRSALVSSKTKVSTKVYTLHLKREDLLACSDSELTWRTKGGVRAPTKAEIEKSPHGSFTKVQISKPKLKGMDQFQLMCKLKDIYFPYIQCDEVSKMGKTTRPIEFQVNGVDLAEVEGGEVAITNLHSCNGPEFVLHLQFFSKQGSATTTIPGSGPYQEANARLKCVYFPIKEGRESIEMIMEKLKSEGCGVTENYYESFTRVSIRRLGRLLPDARWVLLPFMDFRQKKGDKASLLKRCSMRVKCFIDTDAGFNPTHSKTDLAQKNPFTTTLKNFGVRLLKEEKEINVEIYRAGKLITPLQLEKDYQDWLLQMHDLYDEEINCGEDQPVLVINPRNKKTLGITSDVVRVHQVLKRKGTTWKGGQKIKVLKGACAGVHKNNIYATLEYFLIEGFQGDAGGEARIICRPLGLPDKNGCVLAVNDGITSLDICSSLSLPINVIDSGKCVCMDNIDWDRQVEKQLDKTPSTIDLLNTTQCQELGIDGALPVNANAEQAPPRKIVAVIRPASFNSSSPSTNLDQKYIVKNNSEMVMEVKFSATNILKDVRNIYTSRVTPSSCKGFQGLYIFNLECKFPVFFQTAGAYTFSFHLTESSCKSCERRILVKGSSKIGKWRLLSNKQRSEFNVRVGSCFPPLSIACYDIYDNRIPFASLSEVMVKLKTSKSVSVYEHKFKTHLSADKLTLNIKDIMIESNELDTIRPHYKASLEISSLHELVSMSIQCQVTPGPLKHVIVRPPILENILLLGSVIKELKLEMFDAYSNHVEEGLEVKLNVDGFCCEDPFGLKRKVDDCGCIDLGGLLKVTAGYGRSASFSVLSENEIIFMQEFQTENRELRVSSGVPECCTAGSLLEDVVFEIVDSKGDIDVTVHDDEKSGQSHTLTIKSVSVSMEDSVRYAFRHGRCSVPAIPLPLNEGLFCIVAAHSRYSELHLSVKVAPIFFLMIIFVITNTALIIDDPYAQIPVVAAPEVKPEIQASSSSKMVVPLEASPSLKNVDNLMMTVVGSEKEIVKYGLRIKKYEDKSKVLTYQKARIEQMLFGLEASIEPHILNHLCSLTTKEEIIKRIESKDQSAAAILCGLNKEFSPHINFMEEVVGPVALIGTVCTNLLSSVLAEYLGEDQMLAVVCRSFEAVCALEMYEKNGEVDFTCALHALAAALGKSIVGRFNVICLEDISPYTGVINGSDLQRRLALPDPILPSGNVPPGFLGYAVNTINLDRPHLQTMTLAGYGLRETLFYRLFGKLQIYRTREYMIQARACINYGAVSLDGGILRENGIISLGHGSPEICFPVVLSDAEMHMSPEIMKKLKRIEECKSELDKTECLIKGNSKAHEKSLKKFHKKKDKYTKLLNSIEPVRLEYQSDVKKNLDLSPK
ncbi:hypothetical protein Ddye_030567 [Dipteronia dyeriana]|uniref:Gamma-irradiation and mitomycin c induced 1 n=1 Tax=Dipteronia dyeriana TaxID=168575 RepID=A0AAD9WMT1_9ROSI|nr:hypothetical protein Ddye_030567 [Dipteronia dyeriana]